jgi:hypothetical protein
MILMSVISRRLMLKVKKVGVWWVAQRTPKEELPLKEESLLKDEVPLKEESLLKDKVPLKEESTLSWERQSLQNKSHMVE